MLPSSEASRALRRGGDWGSTTYAGVLSLGTSASTTYSWTNIGFRVAK